MSFLSRCLPSLLRSQTLNLQRSSLAEASKTCENKFLLKNYSTNITFGHQESLNRLPVPDLAETLARYRKFLSPIQTTAEMEDNDRVIEAFGGQSGKKLHKTLEELNDQSPTSWVEGFWDTMYLELRMPLPVNVSPYFVISNPPDGFKDPKTAQAERSASLIHSLFRFQQLVRNTTSQPDTEGKPPKPLCMFQYTRALGTTRVPKYARDELETFMHSRHIVILRKDRIYRLDVMEEGSILGKEPILSVDQLKVKISKIIEDADKVQEYPSITTLTTDNRDVWADHRSHLIELDPKNKKNFHEIETSLFVLCLDEESPDSLAQTSQLFLHSGNRSLRSNRWYDKLQVIVTGNGQAGVNMEHAPIDGHTALRLLGDVFADSVGTKALSDPSAPVSETFAAKEPQLLEWKTDSSIQTGIENSATAYQKLIESTEVSVLDFKEYGKDAIKKAKFSPDAFVQMAYQVAYYRQYGKSVSTYESCMMKNFLHGRTETIRSVSSDSVALCRHFDLAKSAESKQLLVKACQTHSETAALCKEGKGVDRHLFVLNNLAKQKMQRIYGYRIPEFFLIPAYSEYMSNILSTSNCSSDVIDLFGFGAVHPKGLGVAYCLKDQNMVFTVTSFKKPDANDFIKHLQQTLRDFNAISKE